mgnify:CR=1 FL=1
MIKRTILDLFAKSPFGSIQMHMKKVIECAQQLGPLFEAVFTEDWDKTQQVTNFINPVSYTHLTLPTNREV